MNLRGQLGNPSTTLRTGLGEPIVSLLKRQRMRGTAVETRALALVRQLPPTSEPETGHKPKGSKQGIGG